MEGLVLALVLAATLMLMGKERKSKVITIRTEKEVSSSGLVSVATRTTMIRRRRTNMVAPVLA